MNSALLVDSSTFYIFCKKLEKRIDLTKLSDKIFNLTQKQIYFSYYYDTKRERYPLQRWASANGWKTMETLFPFKKGVARATSTPLISANLADLLVDNVVTDIYLISNDGNLAPMLEILRKHGVKTHLFFPKLEDYAPYKAMSQVIDNVVYINDIPDVFLPFSQDIEEPAEEE